MNINNLNSFNCEKIVSASDILKAKSKKKIMALQTLSRYETKYQRNKKLFDNILNKINNNNNTVSVSLVGSFSQGTVLSIWGY